MKVGFVVLHYGSIEMTDRCVRSLLHLEDEEEVCIVIVDNEVGKDPEKRRRFVGRYAGQERITVLHNTGEGGFSEANNLGYAYAREKLGCGYICLLNNDIEILQKDFIRRMKTAAEWETCHVLAPDVVRQRDGAHQNPMDRQIHTERQAKTTILLNGLALRLFPMVYPAIALQIGRAEKAVPDQVFVRMGDIVPFGACLILTPLFTAAEKKALTPETHFFYEEYILTLRCQRAGYRIVYDPALQVLHESGGATKKTYRQRRRRIRFKMEQTREACGIYLAYLREGKH